MFLVVVVQQILVKMIIVQIHAEDGVLALLINSLELGVSGVDVLRLVAQAYKHVNVSQDYVEVGVTVIVVRAVAMNVFFVTQLVDKVHGVEEIVIQMIVKTRLHQQI